MKLRNRRGANAVEFALTAPVLFLTIFGVFDCGWFLCHQVVLDEITSDVARSISYSASETIDENFSTAEAKASASWEAYGLPGYPSFDYTIENNGSLPSFVTVKATVDYSSIGPWNLMGSDKINTNSIMTWQGEWQ